MAYIIQVSPAGHTLIAYTYFTGQNCRNISGFITAQVPFNVRANILSACTVSATDLNFGSVGVLNSNVDATNTISVQCSNGTPYSLSLDGGLTGATNPALRKMTNGGSDVTYGIYQNSARTIPWGDIVGTNTISAVGKRNNTKLHRLWAGTSPGHTSSGHLHRYSCGHDDLLDCVPTKSCLLI